MLPWTTANDVALYVLRLELLIRAPTSTIGVVCRKIYWIRVVCSRHTKYYVGVGAWAQPTRQGRTAWTCLPSTARSIVHCRKLAHRLWREVVSFLPPSLPSTHGTKILLCLLQGPKGAIHLTNISINMFFC